MPIQQTPYPAPDFSLPDPDGNIKTLTDFRGSWLVLYFYPEDDTPGCTLEACSLRDVHSDITSLGAQVVGISMDDPTSHAKFRAKYSLNFTLLSDHDKTAINAYGAWGKKMFGNEGVLRRTFLISPDGQVVKVWGRVTPVGHGEQIVAELKKQQA